MDAKTKKTLISVAIAIVIVCVILGVTAIGLGFYVFRQHINTQFVSRQAAESEIEQTRRRFAGQQPLIELPDGRGEPIIHQRNASQTELHSIRVLAFDPRAEKLVRVSVPFWLLKMAPNHDFNLRGSTGDLDFDSDRIKLTVEDLERAGPGLLIDTRDRRNGALVIVWTE